MAKNRKTESVQSRISRTSNDVKKLHSGSAYSTTKNLQRKVSYKER
jgi:hypothetical protein